MTDTNRETLIAKLQTRIDGAKSRLEAELDTPDDIWADHIREAIRWLDGAYDCPAALVEETPPKQQICAGCNGRGVVGGYVPDDSGMGSRAVNVNCPDCNGTGRRMYAREVSDGCDTCNATGKVEETPQETALKEEKL